MNCWKFAMPFRMASIRCRWSLSNSGLQEYHEFLGVHCRKRGGLQASPAGSVLGGARTLGAGRSRSVRESPEADEFTVESEAAMPEGCRAVRSPTTASVWKVAVELGQHVMAGEKLIVLEAMKMEIAVAAPIAGVIEVLNCVKGAMVLAGQNLVTLRQEVGS